MIDSNNCSYSEDELKAAYNSHLANNYGNLLNRLIHLGTLKNIDINDSTKIEESFREKVSNSRAEIEQHYEEYELFDAVSSIIDLISYGNQYVHEKEPWKLNNEDASVVLNNVSLLVMTATILLEPIIPDAAIKAMEAIKRKEKIILFPRM